MRILHFAESFAQPTETFIKRYVQKSCRFAEVGLVAFNIHDIDDELKSQVSFFEITGRFYTRKNVKGAARYLFEKLTGKKQWYPGLNAAIETFKPDIIHCHFGNEGINMMGFNRVFKTKIPYVTSFYGYDISSQPAYDKSYRKNLKLLLQRGSGFFAEGPELKKKIMSFGASDEKCLVNPLLIPGEEYPVKAKYRKPGDPVKFLFVGRFVEKKGFHLFLKALAQPGAKMPEFSVDIVGSGPYREIYEQIISEYGLEPFVTWHGMVQHEEVIKMMKDYDFLVHPSLTAQDNDSEGGAPTIIIEAQAIGLPVIASNHADIPYVMGYHDFLSAEGDINSLMASIENMIKCPDIERCVKQGFEKVKLQHDLKSSEIYEANLKELISRN